MNLTICNPKPRANPRIIWYPIHFPEDVSGAKVDKRPVATAVKAALLVMNGR